MSLKQFYGYQKSFLSESEWVREKKSTSMKSFLVHKNLLHNNNNNNNNNNIKSSPTLRIPQSLWIWIFFNNIIMMMLMFRKWRRKVVKIKTYKVTLQLLFEVTSHICLCWFIKRDRVDFWFEFFSMNEFCFKYNIF